MQQTLEDEASTSAVKLAVPRFVDIGVNLTDRIFRGKGGRTSAGKHEDDFDDMMRRSAAAGLKNMIITGGSLRESEAAIKLAVQYGMFSTTGCHPTRSKQFDNFEAGPEAYLRALDTLIEKNKLGKGPVVAIGECGLDYDRFNCAPAETQQKYFRLQLGLAKKRNLPLFLHSRAAHADFVTILREEGFGEDGGRQVGGRGGVIHSFTGHKEEIVELTSMGFHFSLNGCGLKTAENLEAAAAIPLDRLLLETDAPWCGMKSTQASNVHLKTLPKELSDVFFPGSTKNFVKGKMVKGRNEPNAIGGVAWVVSRLKGVDLEEVCEAAWRNTAEVFGLGDVSEMIVPETVEASLSVKKQEAPPSLIDPAAFSALS